VTRNYAAPLCGDRYRAAWRRRIDGTGETGDPA